MYVASSISSIWNFHRENISREGVMKRYALLYDHVIFNRRGVGIGPGEMASSLGECVSMLINPGETLADRKSLGKNKAFCDIFVDCWDFVSDANRFESDVHTVVDESVNNRIGEFCHQEIRRINGLNDDSYAYDIDDVKELYGDLSTDLGINQLLLREGVELVPSYAPIVGRALSNEYSHQGIECHNLFNSDILVPDFDALSWDEIIDLRSDKYIHAFRKVVFDLARSNPDVNEALVNKVQSDLWKLVSESKPNVLKTFLTGFLGNLPSPTILNPIGVGSLIKDTYKENKLNNNYGHVFFIQGIRSSEN